MCEGEGERRGREERERGEGKRRGCDNLNFSQQCPVASPISTCL